MSKMGLLETTCFSFALMFLTQIHHSAEAASQCRILSATASGASSILVKWEQYPGATSYLLDLREKNSPGSAPVVTSIPRYSTVKDVQGLSPGTEYKVTLKVFVFYYVECVNTTEASTVPDKSQIIVGRALSSTSVFLEWRLVTSADWYQLEVYTHTTGLMLSFTYTNTTTEAVVRDLHPSTDYDCYIYTGNDAGLGSASKVRTITTLVRPPEGIEATQTGQDTARVTWQPVENVLLYQVKIQDGDDPSIRPSVHNITDTMLDVQGILPCSNYLISVSSYNRFLVPSEPANHTYTTNKLTPVSAVFVDYSCTTNSVTVWWSPVFGADTYRAKAIAENGTEMSCMSNGTNCDITGLNCGQGYVVHVTPRSENCENVVNATQATFHTVPCPPGNLNLVRECNKDVIHFSWSPTNNADHYYAQAVDSQGRVHPCLTEDNFCNFTRVVCGRRYDFTVYSRTAGACNSDISSTVSIRTAPCIPHNLQTSANCSSDVLLSTWDHAEGAQRYTVSAVGNRRHSSYSCTSITNSCAMEGLTCGEHLSINITAFDSECNSPPSMGLSAETVPCAPFNVSAVKDCGSGSLDVTWKMNSGALFYVAMAKDGNGSIHSCNSMIASCKIVGLKCSTHYDVYVIASNFMCNSTESEMVTIETGSCPPNNLIASLNCAANEALISWNGQPQMNSFTATIVDEDEGLLSCSSTNTSCKIPNLKCGTLYIVTVSHHDGICPSMPSEPIYMESVPCGPANIRTDVGCESGGVSISWNQTSKAEGYTVVISDVSTHMTFNSTEPVLSVDTLECGKSYTVRVMSFNHTCTSFSTETTIREAPCVPTNVITMRNCSQSFVDVMWQESRGAKNYTAAAMDVDGERMECVSDQSRCRLEGIMCGHVYNVSVAAVDDACTSTRSPSVMLQTEPCPPSQLMVSLMCTNNSATLSWDSSTGAASYTGKAVCSDGHNVTCEAGLSLGCVLEGLHCGKEYSFTVSASDGRCQNVESDPVNLSTAPCTIQSVMTSLNCSTNVLTTSWAAGPLPLNHSVTAVAWNGTETLRCVTEDSSCALTGLQCGRQYSVVVKAISSTCEGPESVPEVVHSVPCVPTNIQTTMECSNNTLLTSWDAAAGALSYFSTLTGSGSFSWSCPTTEQSCQFAALQCAQDYVFSVTAVNDRCNSSWSSDVMATTAPCDPTDVSASLDCSSGVATVTWMPSAGADSYSVLAETVGHMDSCVSTGVSCELSQLQCGEEYTVTVLAGDAKCNSSVLAMTSIITAPCPPTIQSYSVDCSNSSALITWAEDEEAQLVTITASSDLGHSQSCSSASDSSCLLDELQCGNTYNVEAVAHGAQCVGSPSSAFHIITAPCTPTNVDYLYSCETGITVVNWDETLGKESFYVHAEAEDHVTSCSTDVNNCSLPSLLCSRTYNVQVMAVAEHCNSSVPGMVQIQTAPCAPMSVGATLLCDENTAEVTWESSVGAVMYNVTATGRDRDVKKCGTNTTSCQIANMNCAEMYNITVTPFSTTCQGEETPPYSYVTGPCPPSNIQVSLHCVDNTGLVTWDAATQADMYEATAESLGAHVYNCSTSGTGCSFTNLNCGENIGVTVVTVERGCRSEPSELVTFQSVICPPTGLIGLTTCSNNDITVSWDPSPDSGVEYFIHSREEDGVVANYSTTQTSHLISGLQCGEMYSVSVAASDSECTSVFSETIITDTAPCPPSDLTVETECSTNLATLAWTQSSYAVSYTATVTGSHGHVVSCSTNSTLNCSMPVECGRQYSGVVVASSETCNSSTSAMISFDSAPCLPENVQAELDCNSNTFAVQWEGSTSDVGLYTAMAIGSDGSRETCESLKDNCTIQNVKCGVTYSLLVTTSTVDCGIIKGSNYKMQSAPCTPDTVSVDLQCSTHEAFVTWENSGPDQTQEVSAVDSRGIMSVVHSNSSNCTFEQLSCGEIYSISVVGHTDTCSSEPTLAEQLNTAPCIPTHVVAHVDCSTGITVVTWDSALGANSYTVYAQGSLDHYDECTSSDTNCNFQDLACGQDYNITVVARHDTCESFASEPVTASTGPCPHSGLKTTLDCDTNSAMVSWTPGSGILHYNASADAFDIDHEETCWSTNSSCNITSLRCGESYKVSVSGQGQHCLSPAQDWHRVNTAPCPPTQLSVTSTCQSNNISVSWEASQGSVSYTAVAEDADGRQWSCDTDSTSCQVSNLPCGQEYSVYVVGVDQDCTGSRSEVTKTQTAPCIPESIQNHLDCLSGTLNITWQSTGYFLHFQASVMGNNGLVSSICDTNEHHCVVQNLECGLTYNVTVVAMDETCNSSNSPVKQVSTAPCPISSFQSTVDCRTGAASVTWNDSVPGVSYTVSATDAMNRTHNCSSSTNMGCNLTALECGTEYNISITPSRDDCVGRDSMLNTITTVPCIPQLSDVEIDCLTNSAWVTYNKSTGAENYVVIATDRMGDMLMFECNFTSDGMCSLPPLACSQNLTFTVRAQDQQCASAPSNAITSETAPCPPENVTQSVDCDDGTINVSWSSVLGAESYTATLTEISGGRNSCCKASDHDCDVTDLPCGQMYILHVTAEGRTCNSSESERIITRTVPCVPENLNSSLSCSTNVASVSWSSSEGGQLYTVTAEGEDGHVHECQSPSSQCDLTDLHCGRYYTTKVTAEDMVCTSKPSDSVLIKTVPCTPENTSAVIDCESNSLVVSWSDGAGADSYVATLQDSIGQSTSCLGTTEGSCNVTGVGCGQIYHVSVISSDGYCDSLPTSEIETPPVPCKPANLAAMVDCTSQTALVSWFPSDGAESYTVSATSASGSAVECNTNLTNCELEGMSCGQRYAVSLMAVGESCSSIEHMTGELITAPCYPEMVTTQYSVTIGQVQWDMTAGAEYFTVTAETSQGLTTSCNTTDTYCPLYNMDCGQIYNVTVSASNHVCKDVSSSLEEATIMTEPCPPNNVQTSVACDMNQGSVSWESSWGARSYVAHLAGRDGHSLSCYTSDTSCSVDGLHCGVIYHTSVIAVGEMLNSSSSTTVMLVSAPCSSEEITAILDCYNNTAVVSWSSASGANTSTVTAESADGYLDSCESDEDQCELTDLKCGQTYNITVTTAGNQCLAQTLSDVTLRTRPCKPLGVGVNLQCGTSMAKMYWNEQEGVDLYVATASCSMGTTQCNSTNSTCQFTNLLCGETYKLSVTASSSLCFSEDSSVVQLQTDPCQPTDVMVINNGTCNNDTAVLEWSESKGALFYTLAVTGVLGFTRSLQTNSTTLEVDLPCGQLFNFTVVAQDERCESTESLPEQYKSGPCIPEHVQIFTSCEDSLGAVSWEMSAGAETYLAVAVGLDGHTHECTSNSSSCMWDDLHCGEVYTVHVIANDYLCTSQPSNSTAMSMAPCTPENVTTSFNCSTKVASLSWNVSETAEFYIVKAENNDGHTVQISTNDTWTFISEFQCGHQYFLSVQATDSMCTSVPSQPLMLVSEPCAPTNISSYMNCISNIAVVSWTGSAGAEFYTAAVTTEDGQSNSCWSDNEHCGMPNVQCGQNYSVTVIASNRICDSDPSEAETLQSVPCVPSDVDVTIDCSTNQAVVSWSASDGAMSYKVTAESTSGDVSGCESSDLSCTLSSLTCGRSYSVLVVAVDDICSSLPSLPVNFNSVPCTPDTGSIVLDCYTNTALMDWDFSEGAEYYMSTARSSNGNVSTCTTNFTNCELMELQCGQVYNVITVAMNDECSSSPSSSLQVESVPCPPENVVSSLDCSTNTASVQWQASPGAQSYIVQALGIQEHQTSCETNSTSCVLTDLACGFTYNVSVIAANGVCNVSQSAIQQMQAVPCVPQEVAAEVVCDSGSVAVSWEPSKGASSYMAVAQGNGGYASLCNTSETTCVFSELLCGLNYTITVIGSDDTCSSAESSAVDVATVPCAPQKATAEMACSNDTGLVWWEEGGDGVSIYKVVAVGPDGHMTECDSIDSSCLLPSMHCGQRYNVTVTAQDGRCDNSHAHLSLQSAPCRPTSVKASLRCQSNSAAVTWEQTSGALSYIAIGVAAEGIHQAECNNTMPYCDLNELQCGQTYNVSVFGQDQSCSSVHSDTAYVRTAPCPPQNVAVDSRCSEGSMDISWSPDPDAEYFLVTAVSNTGAILYCNSSNSYCSIDDLPCGQSYNVTVISGREDCESKPSLVAKTSSAPCAARNADGQLDCVSNSAGVVWGQSEGATKYMVLAESTTGHRSNCTSSSSPCIVPDLECGALYTFNVLALNNHCSSNESSSFEIETGPCALHSINATTECNSETILVEWEKTTDNQLYLVTAEADDLTLISCNSSTTSCVLEDVRCGSHYSIIVSASSDKCSSLRSPPRKIQTAPCESDEVTVELLCEENGAAVSWTHSSVAMAYHLTAVGSDGHVVTYNTSVNNCSLSELHCGQTYNLSITGRGGNCSSPPSTSSFTTAPCAPADLVVDFDCETKSASLSWDSSDGAVEYFSCAQPSTGEEMLYCDSTDPFCTFEDLECGTVYNFSVKASNGICNTSFSAPLQAGAAPCPPANVTVRMQEISQTHWAMVSWDQVNCSDVEYFMMVTGRMQNDAQMQIAMSSYWLPRPYFEVPLPCSTAYNLTVTSRNSGGVGQPSNQISGVTVPCPPQNVQYTGNSQNAVLSWDSSVFATSYTAYGVSGGSRVTLCTTSSLSCQINNSDPSTAQVTASNAVGESSPSQNVTGPVVNRRRRDLWGISSHTRAE